MATIEDVGVVIHVLRVIQGMSQGELAEASGVRNSSISNYERGKSVPKFETLQKLADGLGMPLSVVEEAQRFIRRIQARSLAAAGTLGEGSSPSGGGFELTDVQLSYDASGGAPLDVEIEQVTSELGRLTARALRLVFALLAGAAREQMPPPEPDS